MSGPVDAKTPAPESPVELTACVVAEGSRYVATVKGLNLEGSGRTPDAAQDALVQVVRGWLERLDTTGKLGEALGIAALDEEAEVVLKFVDGDGRISQSSD